MEMRTKIENTSKYFSRILNPRHKEKNDHTRKNITIYDTSVMEIINEWAYMNNTTFSGVVANLLDDLVKQIDSPQKTMESFEFERDLPALDGTPVEWRKYLKSISTTHEYRTKVDCHLNSVLNLCNQRNGELER